MMTDTVSLLANGKAANVPFAAFLSFISFVCRFISVVLLMILVPVTVQAKTSCDSSPDVLGARFEQTVINSKTGATSGRTMELWRDGDRVMFVYPDRGIAEQWERNSNGALHLTTWFDKDRHGIEYMPEDIGSRSDPKHWQEKWQLFPDSLLQKMQIIGESGYDCKVTRKLMKNSPVRTVKLEWLVAMQLPENYSVSTINGTESWTLKELVTDQKKIRQTFDQRSHYKTTDYIDIGDNEDDPFLRKMIHLGFVSHHASGFYDSDGHALESGGHKH